MTLDDIYHIAEEFLNKDDCEAHVVELLRFYLKFRPEQAKVWMQYGDALRVLGRCDEAFSALKMAFDKCHQEEHKGHVAVRLAMLTRTHVSPIEAKKWYDVAAKALGPDLGWLWVLRGANFAVLGDFEQAIECYTAVVQSQADEKDEALLNLGLVYRAMEKYDEAIDCFRQALSIDSSYKEARGALQGLEDISNTINLIQEQFG